MGANFTTRIDVLSWQAGKANLCLCLSAGWISCFQSLHVVTSRPLPWSSLVLPPGPGPGGAASVLPAAAARQAGVHLALTHTPSV